MTNEQKAKIDAAFNEGGDALRFFRFGVVDVETEVSISCHIYHQSRLAEQDALLSQRPKFIQPARRDDNGFTEEYPE